MLNIYIIKGQEQKDYLIATTQSRNEIEFHIQLIVEDVILYEPCMCIVILIVTRKWNAKYIFLPTFLHSCKHRWALGPPTSHTPEVLNFSGGPEGSNFSGGLEVGGLRFFRRAGDRRAQIFPDVGGLKKCQSVAASTPFASSPFEKVIALGI